MKKILVINPSLRLHSTSKFLPVGVASVMTYLQNLGIEFDLLDIDIHEIEDNEVVEYLEKNRYDIILTGSIVTHYKWMKWLTKTIRHYNPKSIIIVGNSVAGSIPTLFLTNSDADIAIMGEGELSTNETKLPFPTISNNPWKRPSSSAVKLPSAPLKIEKN